MGPHFNHIPGEQHDIQSEWSNYMAPLSRQLPGAVIAIALVPVMVAILEMPGERVCQAQERVLLLDFLGQNLRCGRSLVTAWRAAFDWPRY